MFLHIISEKLKKISRKFDGSFRVSLNHIFLDEFVGFYRKFSVDTSGKIKSYVKNYELLLIVVFEKM